MINISGPRKLNQEEHGKTRTLYEEVFTQDTKEFLDYYYSVKTKDNEIYVMEDGDKIVSMIHLNPYQVRVGKDVYKLHYIVAVATHPDYRKRGLMASLLHHTMEVMAERGEPFTFLMPAAEAIYKPFGFETVYWIQHSSVQGKKTEIMPPEIIKASVEDCQEMAAFANAFLAEQEVVTQRDAAYYEVLLQEYASEQGGILLAKREDKIVGQFAYAKGEGYEVMEPLFIEGNDFLHSLYVLTGGEKESVHCMAYGEEPMKPTIMVKVLDPAFCFDLKKAKIFLNEVV